MTELLAAIRQDLPWALNIVLFCISGVCFITGTILIKRSFPVIKMREWLLASAGLLTAVMVLSVGGIVLYSIFN